MWTSVPGELGRSGDGRARAIRRKMSFAAPAPQAPAVEPAAEAPAEAEVAGGSPKKHMRERT